ncbi:dynamin family protein [Rhodococcus sp. X156]|uniref:dynamin family protein n=1 Tax=Rhodococcus sp. X156 TaxID=2499145 RepID=UPI000FD8F482|nr:dynamin family protein [Rhodococcus sp. X156]
MSGLPTAVRAAITELSALLAEADPTAAAQLSRQQARPTEAPTVVLIGETNRGKSSLVNALLATPELSPVQAGPATSTYLVLRHGPQWSAQGRYADERPPVPVDLAELPAWVCGGPNGRAEPVAPPRYVEVCGPVPLLANLTLVDTPGVGGLRPFHAELATEAAATATALLMVVDASSPFTRGELDFLRQVSERVETVVFALTKTDAHRGWREVLAADRALLAEHAPRFAEAPFLTVSARLATLAAQAPSREVATTLRLQSGISDLQEQLQRLVTHRAAMLADANTLRALHSALGHAAQQRRDRVRVLRSGAGTATELRRRRAELLAQRRTGQRGWSLRLRALVQHARVESTHEVARHVREVQAAFRAAVDNADREALAALPGQLEPALAGVADKVSAALAERLRLLVEQVLAELFTPEELAALAAQTVRAQQVPLVIRPVEKRQAAAEDRLMVIAGASGGIGLGRLALMPLALVPGLNVVLIPLTLGLGAGAAWWMARARGHLADKTHVKQWSGEVFAEARASLDQVVAEQLIDAEHQLSAALDEALATRLEQIDGELHAVDEALRMDGAERAEQLSATERQLASLLAAQDRAASLLTRVRAVRDTRA